MRLHPRLTIGLLAALILVCICGSLQASEPATMDANPAGGSISHHALHATIDPATAHLNVIDTLTVLHRSGVPGTKPFPFLLAKKLEIESIEGIGIDIESKEGRIRPRELWFQPPYAELGGYETSRSVTLRPRRQDQDWPTSLQVIVTYSGTVYDSLQAPRAAYARGFETTSGLIDPRGAYLSYGTFWVPQRPDERFTFRCALETPEDWHGVSQGGLIASRVKSGRRINVWDCPHPMEEVYFIGGPYTLRQKPHAGVEVMTFTYAATDESLCERYIAGTARYLDLYGGKIGPYPFAKFALVENFWQTGFGMPSFTLLGDRVIRLPFILDTSYGHEILHNWWGNGVFVDYQSGNWCEGLTAYGADYLYKEQSSSAEARDYRRTALQGYLDYVSEAEDFSLRLFRQREDFATQAIGYSKSMMVYHQIRRLLGEEKFWSALGEFYAENQFQPASWDDLFTVFGRKTGRDLSAWKEQWLERTGAPSLELDSYKIEELQGGYKIEVVVAQTQDALYQLLVPVAVGWVDHQSGVSEERIATENLDLTERTGSVRFELSNKPEWIAVDPEYDVLRRISPAEIPPAISRTLGADTAAVVIASNLPAELESAYRKLADEWSSSGGLAVLSESELTNGQPPDLPIWFLGAGDLARGQVATLANLSSDAAERVDSGWMVDGIEYPAGHGVVLAGGPPDRPERAWTLVEGTDSDQVTAMGRKIPHYGKYSYLVFEGSTNVAKGSWEVETSPLRIVLAD